ncbi:tRNA (5-methylaminomethyl-2-thiouridine)(34)-methyltransferase MnmD [Acetivibrio cellulolyticus]|uniref:tRNA (5-methylaminomethyl-2-thiouridine)(34)-methyltransferase MnmD n=1 Tax=Acetivibrio cellulolyticus TaxID=35830 RepID=UPI0001E2E2D1|nr:tRNA (5-methylaminomethyl-2-thiouridine)(34)-methyltransferase MnmD [Acetivibrio cellulolyticus]
MFIPSYLVNEHFDDRYFDVVSALDEAQQIYFRNNNLIDRIAAGIEAKTPLIIGETGFGAGRVVISLMEFLQESGLKNISIEYNTVELYPMDPDRMFHLLSEFKDRAGDEIDTLVNAYRLIDTTRSGWHSMKIQRSFGTLDINLWIGEALEMVNALENSCDVWFLDGHSPKKNPSIWRPELLMEIGKKTKVYGTCSTFTVAGAVKRALIDAGFTLKKLPGCGGKNEVLHGTTC